MATILSKDKNKLLKINVYDKTLICVLAVLCIIIPITVNYASSPGHSAQVIYRDKLIKIIDINKDSVFKIPINKGDVKLEVKDKKIRIIDSPCAQKICVRSGWISAGGQCIICAPNRILIVIKSSEQTNYNALSY
ncbi:MAG: NusG domain II-containing protein [bacterium]